MQRRARSQGSESPPSPTSKRRAPVWASAFALVLAACGSDDHGSQAGDSGTTDGASNTDTTDGGSDHTDAATPTLTVKLAWKPCPVLTDGSGSGAECAATKVPLLYDEPKGSTISLFVKRIPAAKKRRGQLWLLNGGPGYSGAGADFEDTAVAIAKEVPDLDIYIPDHRGTGRSKFFECSETWQSDPSIVVELELCGDELRDKYDETLPAYRTTSAAQDVATLIASTREASDEVIVYGASYGGYWLHRLLQVAPEAVSAAVFESSPSGGGWKDMLDVISAPAAAGKSLLALCADDPECKQRLGDDPYDFASSTLDDFEAKCPALPDLGWDRTTMQSVLTTALDDAGHRSLLPAAFARIARCSEDDVTWVDGFLQFVILAGGITEPRPHPSGPSSRALYYHIGLSELFGTANERAELTASMDGSLFSAGFRDLRINEAFATWPVYEADEYQGETAKIETPVLILHGLLDARTPIAMGRALAKEFSGAHQSLVEFPTALHGVRASTEEVEQGLSCGDYVMNQFLRDPQAKLDTGCAAEGDAIDFSARQDLVDEFAPGMGVWDDAAATSP